MKHFPILLTIALIFFIELLDLGEQRFNTPSLASHFTTVALAAFKNPNALSSLAKDPLMDPPTLILLGSGLVGLTGIVRSKKRE